MLSRKLIFRILSFWILTCGWALAQIPGGHIGIVRDWSHRHVIFTNGGSAMTQAAEMRDARLLHDWVYRNSMLLRADRGRDWRPFPHPGNRGDSHVDWAMSLGGTAGMAVGETPAKYNFNINATPSCANDFVVYTVNAAPGAGSQANLVAFNNLYTGTSSTSCGTLTKPTFLFSYAVGSNPSYLSPVISLDASKIALVTGASPATLYVVKWVANQGTNATTGAVAPGSGGSTVSSVAFTSTGVTNCAASTAADSNSSPFIDYTNDLAYIGADNGRLYRIKGIFNGTPTLDYCVTVAAGSVLSSPVYDSVSGKVFVSDGKSVYAYTPGATSFTAAGSIQVAGTANSVVLSPIVDSTNGFVYVFSSTNTANSSSIVSQMPVSLASHVDAAIGPNTTGYVLDGAFDNAFYETGPSAGTLYACGTQTGAATKPALYAIRFGTNGVMNATPAMSNNKNISTAANPASTCSPLTEFFDGTNDRLFVGTGANAATTGANLVTMWNINSRITSATATPAATATNELGGTTGFTIDNSSALPQASSIYFGTLATGTGASCGANLYCAVKLTQGALQ